MKQSSVSVDGGEPQATEEILYSSDTLALRATIVDRNSFNAEGAKLITFDPLASNVEKHEPFGARFAKRYAINALHIVPAQGDWYQYDDLFDCLAVVAKFTKPGATLYGSSMGGYAATTFADRLPVANVVALSPQFSIDRAIVPFEKRWSTHAARLKFLKEDTQVAQNCHHYVFYDPQNPDARHADLIADRAGSVTLVPVPGGGHPVGPVLADAGALSKIILAIMEAPMSREEIDRVVLPNLADSPQHHLVLGKQGPLEERERHLRAGLALDPDNLKLQHAMGRWLHASGRLDEAVPMLEGVLRRRVRHPTFREHYLSVCRDAGVEPAVDLVETPAPRERRLAAERRAQRQAAASSRTSKPAA